MLQCYNGSWQTANQRAMQVMRGIGKKKKGNTSKNCKFTDEELTTHYTD